MITLSQVSKSHGERRALDDVTLAIESGCFLAIVGQSGAGKTTLLKAINRLADIDAGQIMVDGEDVSAQPLAALRRRIGYVFQGIGLFPHMSVAENIWLVPRLQGMARAGRAARVAELLALVSLPADFAERYPAQLSGGQAQRVGFARALAAGPSIMLMDEPFGALDPVTRAELGTAYRALHDRLGLTSLLVTHDMSEALLLADRVVVMDEGQVLADMPPRALIRHRGDPRIDAMLDAARGAAAALEALARDA
ncbi:ABC transporter ATP-binding protein [Sphingobium lignivorans]|uniref:Osmoprotectant transport system ATP-binding protein n=1 Tax=Sphingobium lignivorans TaxID=2735886 RepID=A0ABR6NE35_9SPHN|nr:ABC transporter ATP-binding protein [Sphingobium lignivorans]MBB5984922.1 osmoprotectant transport system ATP-binding protein [Sphingobium lignivorans]